MPARDFPAITNTHELADTDTPETPEVKSAPQTGSNSHVVLYILLLIASLTALAGLRASRRKGEK